MKRTKPTTDEETFNAHLTAMPKDIKQADEAGADEDLVATPMDFGTMNTRDAVASGYTDKEGHAVSMAKKDKVGFPTGAYTDIGAGRSSAVVHEAKTKSEAETTAGTKAKTKAKTKAETTDKLH